MAIVVRCECGNEFQTRDENAGRRARCPVCQRELVIPEPKHVPAGEVAPNVYSAPEFLDGQPRETSGKAIASLILGLCTPVFCCLTGLPAIVLGMIGLNDINKAPKRLSGTWMATVGIVLGCLSMMLSLVAPIMLALLLPAVQSAREAARRAQCVNNEKQIGLAMHNFFSAQGTLPPAAKCDASGKPLLSWRVLILPYLGHQALYEQFHFDEPWDSPHNKALIEQMPNVFQCPSEVGLAPGMTTYQVIVDPRSMFTGEPAGVSLTSVTDGTSMTLMVVEANSPVPWTKPDDLSLDSIAPHLGTGSKHPGGFDALMADGSVRFLKSSISPATLRALVTRNGGEVAAPD